MKLKCPQCRFEYNFTDAVKDNDLLAIIKMQPEFGPHAKIVFEYAELFGTTRPIKAAKLLRVLTDLREIWIAGSFVFQKSRYTISRDGIAAGLKVVCNKNLSALENHNYLKKVLVGIAEAEAQKRSMDEEKAQKEKEARLRSGSRPAIQRQDYAPMPEGLRETLKNIGGNSDEFKG